MSATNGVGDEHPGHKIPFWQQACQSNAQKGCQTLSVILDVHCRAGSPWACNEWGILQVELGTPGKPFAVEYLKRACVGGVRAGCRNAAAAATSAPTLERAHAQLQDYAIVLRTGKGPLPTQDPFDVLSLACDQGWASGCNDLGGALLQDPVRRDPVRAEAALDRSCTLGFAEGCSNAGFMHYSGDGIAKDTARGLQYLERACKMGFERACEWMADARLNAVD